MFCDEAWLSALQISGRELFEFNPELMEQDDDEAEEIEREEADDEDVSFEVFFVLMVGLLFCDWLMHYPIKLQGTDFIPTW